MWTDEYLNSQIIQKSFAMSVLQGMASADATCEDHTETVLISHCSSKSHLRSWFIGWTPGLPTPDSSWLSDIRSLVLSSLFPPWLVRLIKCFNKYIKDCGCVRFIRLETFCMLTFDSLVKIRSHFKTNICRKLVNCAITLSCNCT